MKLMMGFHEAANIFPLEEEELEGLANDIRDNGQQVPIEIMNGKIIDGRRRYLACEKAGITPKTKIVSPADPVAYVLSLNLHRRHLTPSQKAMVGARARDLYDEMARQRQRDSGKIHGRGKVVENLPPPNAESGKARDQVGKTVGVSGKTIDHASKVLKNAQPEVIKAVDEGRMAVSTAAILSTEPPEVQREEANKPKRNRTYQSVSRGPEEDEETSAAEEKPGKPGVGVILANEAINSLSRIPKNDPLRKRGFQIVTDWIRRHK